MTIVWPGSATVYCDGEDCNEDIDVEIFYESNNSSPIEDVLAAMEGNGWYFPDDIEKNCYCPECSKKKGLKYDE